MRSDGTSTRPVDVRVAENAPLSERHILSIIAGLLLGLLISSLDQTVVATALPTIVGELGGLNELSWVVTAYLLASTASTPLWGKLGDLYGRKRLYQSAIVIFLVGSALAGLSQNMLELIAFRAVQGLGGGGILVTAQAIIGDVVSPRERGRYQGIFGAVFGVTSVIGPLLGGFFVDTLGWRWVFYINLPIGAAALVLTSMFLPASQKRGIATIDYLGTVLIASAATSLVLLTSVGGTFYPWLSAPTILLALLGASLVVAFVLAERLAPEPVLPLRLFRNRVFSVSSAIGFIVGFAMFGAITFLPLYLQVVKGASPTESGLRLLPLLAGLLVTSTLSGQLITRCGRYKVFPIVGTAVFSLGLFLLSRMDEHTSYLTAAIDMLILGLGLGLVIQVLVIAVQNAVPYRDLGVATSGVTFFRSIGASFGVAFFGAIFGSALSANLRALLPQGVSSGTSGESLQVLQQLPPNERAAYVHAYAMSLQPVFLIAAVIGVIAFVLTWFLEEVPLRATAGAMDLGETHAMPQARSSRDEIERALAVLVGRDSQLRVFQRLATHAGVSLTPGACWLLCCLGRMGPTTMQQLSGLLQLPESLLARPMAELAQAGLITRAPDPRQDGASADGQGELYMLTVAGREVSGRLITAHREELARLLDGWSPEQEAELAVLLTDMAQRLLSEGADGRELVNAQIAIGSGADR